MTTPKINFTNMFTDEGEDMGFAITVNDCSFGSATLVEDGRGNESYNVLSGVGTFESDDQDEILAILLERLNYVGSAINDSEYIPL
ncbi:MAG: hypothetical protein DRN27_09855 [Thermoplasmata archaeon]|nr:MAG: hypothetical protein DRN27_09855 [Thermoplasmata archaeon]